MSGNAQLPAPTATAWRDYVSKAALTLCTAAAVYVLSFGPIFNLTTTKIGGGYMRPAKFPSWADTVNTGYAPLIHVLVGHPRGMPGKALAWYIHRCDFGPSMELDYGDPKKVEADIDRALAKMRKENR